MLAPFPIMITVAVLYASREGQTRKIAAHISAVLAKRGIASDVRDVASISRLGLGDYSGAIVAASVHAGSHEPEMVAFVKKHRPDLDRLPTAFLSVTLSQAGVERQTSTPEQRKQFADGVKRAIDEFLQQTRWRPAYVKPVAGALVYSQYNFLIRVIMSRIAKKSGADTDTSRDYEYTDWGDLDRFVDEFADRLGQGARPQSEADATPVTESRKESLSCW